MTETFSIDFGNAKPLILPPEGTYDLVISEFTMKQAKNEDSRSKGFKSLSSSTWPTQSTVNSVYTIISGLLTTTRGQPSSSSRR